jgi:D-alanine-D-alanine ligase
MIESTEKINKYIEIVTMDKKTDTPMKRKNLSIELDENIILEILSKNYENVIISIIKTKEDLEDLVNRKPDLVFSGIKYFDFNKEEIWLCDYLKENGINHITSNKKTLNYQYNINDAKQIIQKANLATADFFTTQPDEHETEESLPVNFPLFLKPAISGNSKDINAQSVVFDFKKYQAKVLDIYENRKSRTLVENYLSGKEYSVSILRNKAKNILSVLPVEIIANKNSKGHRILDYEARQENTEEVITILDKKIYKEVVDLATKSFIALGGKTMGRIDIKMSYKGILHFIGASFLPELESGYFSKSFMLNNEISYEQMILKIAETALPFESLDT